MTPRRGPCIKQLQDSKILSKVLVLEMNLEVKNMCKLESKLKAAASKPA